MLSRKKFWICFLITFTFVLSGCVDQARIDAQNRAIQQEIQRQQRQAETERQQVESEKREQERWNSLRNPTMPTADKLRSMPNVEFTNTEIDNGFKRWESAWWVDQYIPNSARVINRGLKDGTYIVRGDFGFVRGGSSHTIPFAAAFTQSLQGYRLANLCYNDQTSGMTACIDPTPEEIAKARSVKFLGLVAGTWLAFEMLDGSSNTEPVNTSITNQGRYLIEQRAREEAKEDHELADKNKERFEREKDADLERAHENIMRPGMFD
jgi:outer membrane murein-binding lipoprotein Lpp